MHQAFGLAIPKPWFRHVPVGGEQSIPHQESCARNPRANRSLLVRESYLIYAVNVANGIPITVEHQGRHRLLFFELRDLLGERMHLLLQIVWLGTLCRTRRIVMEHGYCADQKHKAKHGLHHLLPALSNFVRPLWNFRFGHEFVTPPAPAFAPGESASVLKRGLSMLPCRE